LLTCACQSKPTAPASPDRETVILLHGLFRSPGSLDRLAHFLESHGFRVHNLAYPSTKASIEEITEQHLRPQIDAILAQHPCRLHFVTHSLGGILVRYLLRQQSPPQLGRVVMLGPPNQGSELADNFRDFSLFRWLNGPAGQQLGRQGLATKLGPVNFECGVIAGNRSYNPFYSLQIPGPDDGKVSVESTKVAGMQDHLVVPHSHTFLMNTAIVQQQVRHFLRTGSFQKTGEIPLSTAP
jgi:pimeloyl-ACP methyl ester carboxylesterase